MFGPLSLRSASALGLTALCLGLTSSLPTLAEQPLSSTGRTLSNSTVMPRFASATSPDSSRVHDLGLLTGGGRVNHRLSEIRIGISELALENAPVSSGRRPKATMPHIHEQQSAPFAVTGGDSLRAYRELSWHEPTVREAGVTRIDTVDIVVDLIDAATRRRLVLLDSVGVIRDAQGVTSIYGSAPPLAIVSGALPIGAATARAILRRRSIVRGGIVPTITERTYLSLLPSRALTDPATRAQRRRYGNGTEQRDPGFLEAACHGRLPMSVDQASGATTKISFPLAADGGVTMLVIFDADGNRRSIPLITEGGSAASGSIAYMNTATTRQFAALYHDNLLVSAVALAPAAGALNKPQRMSGGGR